MTRISANKLAELLVTASPIRRRRIIYDQKYPADSIVARYRQAMPPIQEFLESGIFDRAALDRAVVRLRADNSGTEWAMEDRQITADALEHVAELAVNLPRQGVAYRAGDHAVEHMTVEGVSVSVRPDFIVTSEVRGKRFSGALKFHFTKNEDSSLKREGAQYVAVLMYEWLRQYGPANATPKHDHCISVDVFRRMTVSAPRASSRRWDDIVAGCQEVAARWPQL